MLTTKNSKEAFYFSRYYNGNLTKDSNKGISNISWNSLNLPNVVTFEDGSIVTYTYAADGTKLRTVHSINGTITTKDYCGSVIYENGAAKLWQTEAGYISMNDSKYHYYLQDHQGNNRIVVNKTEATEEVNHYYAFGGLFSSDESIQPFKYNGKELDTKKDFNWYDYGARQYDATLGRWFAVDPLGEDYYPESSYAYCGNNSINRNDPTGKDYWSTSNPDEIKKFWNWLLQNSNKSLDTYSFSTDLWFKMEDKEFIDAYKKYGQQALTYNDQTNQLYSSYVTYENGEIIVNGINTTAHANNTITLSSPHILTGTPSIIPGFKALNLNKNILSFIKNIFKNKQISKKTIVFGQNGNQAYHTFRHIDKINLSQDVVRRIIINDLKNKHSQTIPGKPFNQTVKIGNYNLQYTAYKLPNGKINIGRIHEVK